MHALITTGVAATAGIVAFLAARELRPSDPVRVKPQLTSVTSTTGAEAVIALTDFLPEATPEERNMLAAHFTQNPPDPPYDEGVAVLLPPPPVVATSDEEPAVSLEHLLEIADPIEREKAILEFLKNLDVTDPAALDQAAKAYLEIAGTKRRSLAYYELAKRIIAHDPSAAKSWARKLPAGNTRDTAMGLAVVALSRDDPEAVIHYLDGIGWKTDFEAKFGKMAVRVPSKGDGRGEFTRKFTGVPGGMARPIFDDAIHAALVGMIDAGDPEGALEKASKIPGSSYWRVAGEAFNHWFSNEPEKALDYLDRSAEAGAGIGFAQGAIGGIAREDPAKANEYYEGLSNEDARSVIGSQMASVFAREDPEFAADWWSRLPATERSAFQEQLALSLANRHPQTSAALADQYPTLLANPETFRSIADRWGREDLLATSEWVATLGEGASRDGAVVSLIDTLTRENTRDLSAAARWAETVTDPELRAGALGKIQDAMPDQ